MVLRIVKRAVAAIFLTLAVWAFFGGHRIPQLAVALQAAPACLKHPLVAVPAFIGLTAVIGRFFCEMMCPLGIMQSLVNWLVHCGWLKFLPKPVRRVCTRLPEKKAQRIVRWSVLASFALLLACGYGAVAYSVEPYSILGRALTGLKPFAILLAAILALAAVGDGRFWCNWICPLGTVFHLASRKAPFGNRVCKGCANCRKCFPKAEASAAPAATAAGGLTRRETVQGLVLLAAAEKTTDGGFAELLAPGSVTSRKASILPPGALSRLRFQRMCLGCGLCIKACATGVLVPSARLGTFGQPELDIDGRICHPDCDRQCAKACPAGAIARLADVPRRDIHIGRAVWDSAKCIRNTDGVACTLCSRKCPYDAIHVVEGAIVVDDRLCIGCGICEKACAARPEPAIVVEGLDVQRVVRPMDEAELIGEMVSLLQSGDAVVIAREGVIRHRGRGRGISPLMRLLDADALQGSLVVDRVIGRAAAAICACGGARKVHALLMSTGAAEFLKARGIGCEADEMVPEIMNRTKDGTCPMEATVKGMKDPFTMVDALRRKLDEMRR